jgi:SAM-dependent methyltransferase
VSRSRGRGGPLQLPDRGAQGPPGRGEADRLEKVYAGYAADPRKRRHWAADNPGNRAIRAELLEAVAGIAAQPLAGSGQVLDVGCGSGWLLAALAAEGVSPSRLHGVDLLRERVGTAQKRLPAADLRVSDARELPFDDREIDLILLTTCLSSMPAANLDRALYEARRVCAEGGLVLCYEPALPNPFNAATTRVPARLLAAVLGAPVASRRLTGFPPITRRLGRRTDQAYPLLARLAPTHRLTAHAPGAARRRRG